MPRLFLVEFRIGFFLNTIEIHLSNTDTTKRSIIFNTNKISNIELGFFFRFDVAIIEFVCDFFFIEFFQCVIFYYYIGIPSSCM